MHLVWEIEYQAHSGRAQVHAVSRVVGPVSGSTDDPTIVALACCAFTYRFWVQMLTDREGRIIVLNVLPDCSLLPWTPAPATDGLAVSWLRLTHRVAGQWPDLEVGFADGRTAIDQSGVGLVEPIVRAGLTSGEGVYDLVVADSAIHGIRLMHEAQTSSAGDPRASSGAAAIRSE